MKKAWFFHLLNDYSGSPRVLSEVVKSTYGAESISPVVVTSSQKGALSGLRADYVNVEYRWSRSRLLTLLRFLFVQLQLFVLVLNRVHRRDIVYVNTLLPFGAAIGAKLKGVNVIYHLHEPQVSPAVLFGFLKWVCSITSFKVIFVSEYLKSQFPGLINRGGVIYNACSRSFEQQAKEHGGKKERVLMLASLKTYKGVNDFLAIAGQLPEVGFDLVLNCSLLDKNRFVEKNAVPSNVSVYEATDDVHKYYSRAILTLNLSHPNKWIESFGMTIIESFHYGVPVLAPQKGGPVELLKLTGAGFNVDHADHDLIAQTIKSLCSNEEEYALLAQKALKGAAYFGNQQFSDRFQRFFKEVFRISE